MLAPTLNSLEAVATELKHVRTELANKQRRRTRLVTGLLRQVDHCLGRLAEVQNEVQALQTACEVLSLLEGA